MEPGSKSREQPMSKPPPTHPPQPHSHQPSHFALHQPSYAYPTSAPYPSFPPPSSSSASYHTSHTLLAQSHPLPSSVQKLSPTIPTSTRQTPAPHLQSQPQPIALPPNPTRQVPTARHRNLSQQQSFSPAFNSSALNAPVSSSAQHGYASPPTSLLSRSVTPGQPQPALSKSTTSHDPSTAGLQHSPVLNRQAAAQPPPQQNVFRNDNFFSTLPQRQTNLGSRQPQQPSPQQQQHLHTQPPQHSSHNADIKISNRNLPFPVDRLSPHAEPFPNSKSLPFPVSHHPLPTSPAGLSPSNTRPPNPGPSSTALPVLSQRSTLPPTLAAAQNVAQSHPSTRGLLYDISKLHAAQCTIIGGKVYNDKGHSICGVLNQHDKPCKRIGKCPFHGVSQPVSAQNSCHGYVNELGTAPAPANDDNGPPGSGNASGDQNGTGVSVTSNPDTGPKGIPKKQQYKHGWSKEEHFLFLRGLQMHDRGSWKQISNVVRSRNATQVQSHAQKYFLRQKQNNKNKRSIHDLTMDSPEMQELEKRFRNGDFSSVVPPAGLSEGLYDPSTGDGGAGRVRDDHAAGLGQGISGANQGITAFAQGNTVGHNMMADGNLPRFGQASGVAMPRLGQGQPVSATTLGSSVSSGVHIPQLQGGHQARGAFQSTGGFMQTHDLLGHTGNAAQKKFNNMKAMRPRSDIPQGRDAFHSGSRPNFGQEVYQSTLTPMQSGMNSMMTVAHGFSPKTEQKTLDPALLQPGIDRGGEAQNDHGPNQQIYTQNGFQGLYGQSSGNNLFHQGQSRPSGENQLAWPYDSDGKGRRPRELGGRESISFQNSFSGMGSDGFGQVSNMPVMSSDNHVVTGFEGPGNHGASFQTALFGSPDAVEVGDNPNSYSINGQPQAGVSINGFAAPAGLQLNGLSVRGQGNVPNTFVRN